MLPVSLGIAKIDELLVAAMGAFRAVGMLDGAPVLLGARGDLGEVGEYPVCIRQYSQFSFSARFR